VDNPPKGLVPAAPVHVERLVRRLRTEHVREIADTSGLPPLDAVRLSLAASVEAYTLIRPTGDVLFMMGAEPASPLTGSALLWMIGSHAMDRHPAAVLRAASWGVERAFAVTGAHLLEQYIPAWYAIGLRFVERLGFEVTTAAAHCRSGCPLMHVFVRKQL
jgi:hypothetical protein